MLKITNYSVTAENKKILNNMSLEFEAGRTYALMGPNGSGKSSLAKSLLGHPAYEVKVDDFLLGSKNILNESVDERVRRGLFLSYGAYTGSGKTTTLYAALNALKSSDKNLVTLEDPIEYSLDGITQSAVHPDIGFTFATGIRALLRQDPDVIMVGEVRDTQTAHVAIQAALTGHMVLSTLHTNDAASTIMRLIDMGIEPCLINASLSGVLAQRLLRTICQGCKIPYEFSESEKEIIQQHGLDISESFIGAGCHECEGLGYKGRTGVFELLVFTPELKALIRQHPVFEDIYAQAVKDGMKPLLFDAIDKIRQGEVGFAEFMRVLL